MPELPDVETFRRYLDATALHRRIESVSVRAPEVLEVAASTLRRHLLHHELTATRRRGKHLFAAVGEDAAHGWLTLHFGMSGFLRTFRGAARETEHDRVVFGLEDDYRLVFRCQRMFGRVGATADLERYIERRELGPDALALDAGELADLIRGHRGRLKSLLMNQSAIAGIGNIYSDEILFQARVLPQRDIDSLDGGELEAVCRQTRAVLEAAIEVQADPERMPDSWITPRRDAGGSCPGGCGGELVRQKVGQRTSVFCPTCQR